MTWNEKPCTLSVRCYVARLIDLHEYLASFPGANLNDNIVVSKINGILLNSIPNICSRQAYVQGFGCETINFKKYGNVFERMEISEYIDEGVVEPFL